MMFVVDDESWDSAGDAYRPMPMPSLQDAARRMRRLMRLRERRLGKEAKTVDAPDLEMLGQVLDLPQVMPGDVIHRRERELSMFSPHMWFDPEGLPIPGEFLEAVRTFEFYRQQPGNHVVSRPFFRAGARIVVSTVYLGIDHEYSFSDVVPLPPIIWETMIFVGGHGGAQWRYATRNAAMYGHRRVVAAVHAAQYMRRLVVPYVPPRRGSSPAPNLKLLGYPAGA